MRLVDDVQLPSSMIFFALTAATAVAGVEVLMNHISSRGVNLLAAAHVDANRALGPRPP